MRVAPFLYAFVVTVALHVKNLRIYTQLFYSFLVVFFIHHSLHKSKSAGLVLVLVVITSTDILVGVNDDVE